jgi:hypothetical protein
MRHYHTCKTCGHRFEHDDTLDPRSCREVIQDTSQECARLIEFSEESRAEMGEATA